MSEIEYCEKCGYIKQQCQCEKPMTNADRIRNMTDEELAEFLWGSCKKRMPDKPCVYPVDYEMCKVCYLEWLQTKVKEGDT